jgi:hypothetical protein
VERAVEKLFSLGPVSYTIIGRLVLVDQRGEQVQGTECRYLADVVHLLCSELGIKE